MSRPSSPSTSKLLPMRWAVIFMAALVVALLVGALTVAQTEDWPAALLAGFAAAGMTITVMHQILG
jgi:hypothetical protein